MSVKQTFRIKLGSEPMYFSGIVDGVICWDARKDAVVFSEYHAACDKINDMMEIGCPGDAYVHATANMQSEYCGGCGTPIQEWEVAGRCEGCDQMTNKPFITCQCEHTFAFAGSVKKKYTCPNCGKRQSAKPKRGRPPTSRGAYNPHPGRKFGRVSDSDWQEIRDACELSGLSLVAWALPMLLKKARRERKTSVDTAEDNR